MHRAHFLSMIHLWIFLVFLLLVIDVGNCGNWTLLGHGFRGAVSKLPQQIARLIENILWFQLTFGGCDSSHNKSLSLDQSSVHSNEEHLLVFEDGEIYSQPSVARVMEWLEVLGEEAVVLHRSRNCPCL